MFTSKLVGPLQSSYNLSMSILPTYCLINLPLINHTHIASSLSCINRTLNIQQCSNMKPQTTMRIQMAHSDVGAKPLQGSSPGMIEVVPLDWYLSQGGYVHENAQLLN